MRNFRSKVPRWVRTGIGYGLRSKGCEGIAQRRARNLHQSRERLAHFQDQEERSGRRQRKHDQGRDERRVEAGEQTKARKNDGEPENENRKERHGDRTACPHKQCKTRLRQICADLDRPRLERALGIGLGCRLFDSCKGVFRDGRGLLRQELIEQDKFGRQVLDLVALGLIRSFGRGNQ